MDGRYRMDRAKFILQLGCDEPFRRMEVFVLSLWEVCFCSIDVPNRTLRQRWLTDRPMEAELLRLVRTNLGKGMVQFR